MPSSPATLSLLAISGSLRAASSNTAVLQALQALAPATIQIKLAPRLPTLPYFNPDLDQEQSAPPAAVQAFRAAVAQADGILLCSPEYAHGVPGVLKNGLDWLVSSVAIVGKPVAVINCAPRATHAHASLCEILRTMSAVVIEDPALTIELPPQHRTAAQLAAAPASAALLEAVLAATVQGIERIQAPG
ncbi:MAG TPA: NAD(P)H-dependent oxidoreductase [Herpetosiphonaceae bacterium]